MTRAIICLIVLPFALSLFLQDSNSASNLTANKIHESMLTTPSANQHILNHGRIEKAINDSSSKNFLILQKMLNQTNHSIGQFSSIDVVVGTLGLILGVSGIILAIFIPYLYERFREPLLEIRIPEYDPPGKDRRYLHALVVNSPHKHLKIERSAAIDTKVEIRFYDANGNTLFGQDPIMAKWVNKPRCLTLGQFDDTKVSDAHRQNVLSGTSGEYFDVVIKNAGNENCYGFNGWSYEFTPTEENKKYEIPKGTFRVTISGIHTSKEKEFQLNNIGPNLEDISLTDLSHM
jgi:hypothetical protein